MIGGIRRKRSANFEIVRAFSFGTWFGTMNTDGVVIRSEIFLRYWKGNPNGKQVIDETEDGVRSEDSFLRVSLSPLLNLISFLLASPPRSTAHPWGGGASQSSACVHARNTTRSAKWMKQRWGAAQWYRRDFYPTRSRSSSGLAVDSS